MRQVQLMRQTTSVGIYWQQKKVARTSSGCGSVENVLPRPYS